jgi:hypothetical protein
MHALLGLLVAFGCVALLVYIWREARREDKEPWKLLVPGFAFLAGAFYLSSQYVFNVGPDDLGALSFAKAHLVRRCNVDLIGFERDKPDSNSGVYRVHFVSPYSFSRLEGVLSCRYDAATQRFTLVQTKD